MFEPKPAATNCLTCGVDITKSKRLVRRDGRYNYRRNAFFCSDACKWAGPKVGKHSPAWKGGRWVSDRGYVQIYTPDRPGGSVREHVLIAEKILGRRLKPNEIVHHINGDKTDNRNSNLLICTRSYHRWLHEEMGRRYMAKHFPKLTESIAA